MSLISQTSFLIWTFFAVSYSKPALARRSVLVQYVLIFIHRSGLVDRLVTHANIKGFGLVWSLQWLHDSSVKNKQNTFKRQIVFQVRGVSLDNKLDGKIAKMKFGQFLFLYFLGRNVDYVTFKKVLEALADQKTSDQKPSETYAMEKLSEKRRPSDHRQDPHNPLYNVETGAQIYPQIPK